jgi:DNA-binding response OmpR family regulator
MPVGPLVLYCDASLERFALAHLRLGKRWRLQWVQHVSEVLAKGRALRPAVVVLRLDVLGAASAEWLARVRATCQCPVIVQSPRAASAERDWGGAFEVLPLVITFGVLEAHLNAAVSEAHPER